MVKTNIYNIHYVSFLKCLLNKTFILAGIILLSIGCSSKYDIDIKQKNYNFKELISRQPELKILAETINKNSDDKSDLEVFAEAFVYIEENYLEQKSPKLLAHAAAEAVLHAKPITSDQVVPIALKGMMNKLDKYSTYLSYKDFSIIESKTRGHFGGVGIKISKHDKGALVFEVISDTPAERKGLLKGDIITHVNNSPINKKSIKQISFQIRGKINSKIKFNILRNLSVHSVQIKRERILLDKVTYNKYDKIAYLKITSFNENTYESIFRIAKKLKPYNTLILDLRDNRGGLLDQAVEVSDIFLAKGKIVEIKGRKPENNLNYSADKYSICPKCKIFILINKETASAAEILASSLHDNSRAILIGEPSYGKGTVQTIVPLRDGSAIKFTTSIYITPSGKSINENGIKPNISFEDGNFKSPLCFDIKSGNDLILKCAKKLSKLNYSIAEYKN